MSPVRRASSEAGFSLVLVGVWMFALLGVGALSADVGLLMTARAQAQNAADAGAMAGAISLLYDDFNDRSPSGPAVRSTIAASLANPVMGQPVAVTAGDVSFPPVPGGGTGNLVTVTVHRTAARANPLGMFLARLFGFSQADITATATAEASLANAQRCVKPFTIPDRWIERQTPPWDVGDTFDLYDNQGQPLANPDQYLPASDPAYAGYDPIRDKGLQLTIKAGTGNNMAPGFYYPLALPDGGGGSDYRWNIDNCNTSVLGFGDLLTAEPGNMVGPTAQGVDALIARDGGAYWDTVSNRLVSSMHPSPRVAIIPVFDPEYYEVGKHNGRNADLKAANFIGFFVERVQGNDVIGRITPVGGILRGSAGPAPPGAFPRVVRLVD